MNDTTKPASEARLAFLGQLGLTAGYTGAVAGLGALGVAQDVVAKSESPAADQSFPTPDYDWTQHQWAFGVDTTKCIGCLRCVEACKRENGVAKDGV